MEKQEELWRPVECWRHVRGYIGLYLVSNRGRVKSLITGRILKAARDKDGYMRVVLCKNGEHKNYFVHRIEWEAFKYPIPEGWHVDHLDWVTDNNTIDNLLAVPACINIARVSDISFENRKRASSISMKNNLKNIEFRKKHLESVSKPVNQLDLDGNFIAEYPSISAASRQTNITLSHISRCCRGERKNAGGFIWKFAV